MRGLTARQVSRADLPLLRDASMGNRVANKLKEDIIAQLNVRKKYNPSEIFRVYIVRSSDKLLGLGIEYKEQKSNRFEVLINQSLRVNEPPIRKLLETLLEVSLTC